MARPSLLIRVLLEIRSIFPLSFSIFQKEKKTFILKQLKNNDKLIVHDSQVRMKIGPSVFLLLSLRFF